MFYNAFIIQMMCDLYVTIKVNCLEKKFYLNSQSGIEPVLSELI